MKVDFEADTMFVDGPFILTIEKADREVLLEAWGRLENYFACYITDNFGDRDEAGIPTDGPLPGTDYDSWGGARRERGEGEDALRGRVGVRVGQDAEGGGPKPIAVLRHECESCKAGEQRHRGVYIDTQDAPGGVSMELFPGEVDKGGNHLWITASLRGDPTSPAEFDYLFRELGLVGPNGEVGCEELAGLRSTVERIVRSNLKGAVYLPPCCRPAPVVAAADRRARLEEMRKGVPESGARDDEPGVSPPADDPNSPRGGYGFS